MTHEHTGLFNLFASFHQESPASVESVGINGRKKPLKSLWITMLVLNLSVIKIKSQATKVTPPLFAFESVLLFMKKM